MNLWCMNEYYVDNEINYLFGVAIYYLRRHALKWRALLNTWTERNGIYRNMPEWGGITPEWNEMNKNGTGIYRNAPEWHRNEAEWHPNKAEPENAKIWCMFFKLGPTDFRLFQSAFVVSRDSLRELHVL